MTWNYYSHMIQLIKDGQYKLIETKGQTKILYLDEEVYAWVNVDEIGEILVFSHNPHKTDNILALGSYRFYVVDNEPKLTDLKHLELFVGRGVWQGYLLPTGLPNRKDTKKRIIPTAEVLTISN